MSVSDALIMAYSNKTPIELISAETVLTEESAYDVQEEVVRRKVDVLGERPVGYKISLTSPSTQRLVGAHEPAYGTLTSANLVEAPAQLKLSTMNLPLVETELLFRLERALPNNPSVKDVERATTLFVAIEIPDSRYIDWFPRLTNLDLICDCAAAGRVVIGNDLGPLEREVLSTLEMTLSQDDKLIAAGRSAEVYGSPVLAVQWLANKLNDQGRRLRAGDIISSGTWTGPIAATAGTYTAHLGSLGSSSVVFEA